MNASQAAVMGVGVNLIALWAAAAAGGHLAPRASVAVPPQDAVDQAVDQARTSLVAAAGRIEAHARSLGGMAAPTRNPFRFGGRAPLAAPETAHRRAGEPAAEAPRDSVAAPAPGPDLRLVGMAESRDGETVVRTAILRAGSELVLAVLGTRIGGRYEVVAMSADMVELEDLIDHGRRTCRLK